MTGKSCLRCGVRKQVVPDEHGFHWCGRCYFLTRIEAAGGVDQFERYLHVKARKSIAARIREYTEGTP